MIIVTQEAIFAHWFTRGSKELSLIGASDNFYLWWRQTFTLPLALYDDYLIYTLVFDLKCYVQNAPWTVLNKSHEPNYIIIAFGKRKWLNHLVHWFMRYNFGKHQVLNSRFSQIKMRSGRLVCIWKIGEEWCIIHCKVTYHLKNIRLWVNTMVVM